MGIDDQELFALEARVRTLQDAKDLAESAEAQAMGGFASSPEEFSVHVAATVAAVEAVAVTESCLALEPHSLARPVEAVLG